MTYIPWSSNISVYNNFVDSQHYDLVDQVNALFDATQQELPVGNITALMAGLLKSMRTHFNTEEVLMQATEYPGIHIHRREHNDHMTELDSAMHSLEETGEVSGDLFLTLRAIVVDHMQTTDLDFGVYLKQYMKEHPDAPLPHTNVDLSAGSSA